MDIPEILFTFTDDDVRIAYQDFGSGPPTVVVLEPTACIEGMWGSRRLRGVFERMAANVRVVALDPRGSGLSDGFTQSPSLEDRTRDITAVMDAVGLETASLIGFGVGAQIAIGFAVAYPERVDRLVLGNPRVGESGRARAQELYPEGEQHSALGSAEANQRQADTAGMDVDESLVMFFSPSLVKHPEELEWLPKFARLVGSRDAFKRTIESIADLDVVDLAPGVQAPTLIIHAVGSRLFHLGNARLLAELIPDSTLEEFEGEDHFYWFQDNWKEFIDAQISFTTELAVEAPVDRVFAVVLFTDLVGSTITAVGVGDSEWRRMLDTHDRLSEQIVADHDGMVVKQKGDGILATFSTPSRAVDAALALQRELTGIGMPIRAGLHAGEVEVRGDDISGVVVNLAARTENAAPDGEVLVTSAIRDMLIGSAHQFESAGSHRLKGFKGEWALHRVGSNSGRR